MAFRWASWVGVMWLPLAAVLALGGCDKIPGFSDDKSEDDDDDDDDKDEKKKGDDDTQEAVDKGDSTGIPECDQYLAKFRECYPDQTNAADKMGAGYRQASGVESAKSAVASSCTQSLGTIQNCTPVRGGATPPAAVGDSSLPPSCREFQRVMDCMKAKVPPTQKAAIEQSTQQVLAMVKNMGSMGEAACRQGLDQQKAVIAQVGCAEGGDSPSTISGTAPPAVAVTPGKEATPFINSRSSVPSTDEWNAQTKEVTVRGSTALNCETKMVREWLRISCRGKNQSGGEPTGVVVTKGGGRGDDYVFTGDKVASLVVRFVPGVDLDARFSWTNKSSTCRVWWPRGAPEPQYKGTFQ